MMEFEACSSLMNWEIENLAGDEGGVVYDEPGD
jgi:hypothetical protein